MNDFSATLKKACSEAILAEQNSPDGIVMTIKADKIRQVFETLAGRGTSDGRMLLTDISAVNIEENDCRFELYYHVFLIDLHLRLTLKCRVEGDKIDSIADIMPAALMPEREIFDMFGLKFRGHGNLPRLFMHNDFEGHPLLREYPLMKRQILLEQTKFE